MDGRYADGTLDTIREEQQNIDRIVDALLDSSLPAPAINLQQKNETSVSGSRSPANISTRNKTRQVAEAKSRKPPASPSSPLPVFSANKQSFESLVNCLMKLNDQNKRLISFVENIAKSAESNNSVNTVDVGTNEENIQVTPAQKALIDGVSDRLDKIEQNLNSNTLICRGAAVSDLITAATTESTTNLNSLKGEVCKSVCGDDVVNIDIANLRVGLFGREKKSLKVVCSNSATKLHLLKQARIRRPTGLFLSEFLTPAKHSIFYNLRQLRKQHPEKFKSVFTRGGNIFYRLSDSDRVYQISTLADLQKIDLQGQAPENSAAV